MRSRRELELRSAIGHSSVHEMSLSLIKHAVLAYLAGDDRRNHGSEKSNALQILCVPLGTASTPIQFFIRDSQVPATQRDEQQVLALFTRDNPNQADEKVSGGDTEGLPFSDASSWRFQLNICARCGEDYRCACNWKTQHIISVSDEQRSLLVFIDSHLVSNQALEMLVDVRDEILTCDAFGVQPRFPANVLRAENSFRLQLNETKMCKMQDNAFGVRITGFSTVSSFVESSYAVRSLGLIFNCGAHLKLYNLDVHARGSPRRVDVAHSTPI